METWIALAGMAIPVVAALLMLERRLARLETDMRWLIEHWRARRISDHVPDHG